MIGKWNKSVILTYAGVVMSVFGIFFSVYSLLNGTSIKYAMICLMTAGVCDLFDGVVARKCKRTSEEKAFGIQLDSLADVVNFTAFPIAVYISIGQLKWYVAAVCCIYAVFSIARLAFFNISIEDDSSPVKYYRGLPVTFSALIFPLAYLLSLVINGAAFNVLYSVIMLAVAFLFVLDFKMPKPKGKAYIFLSMLAVVLIAVYIIVL